MNLIEKLGGYENAKDEWLREGAYPSPNYFYYRQLGSELLNYRRTNNIYEVSDQVVLVNKYDSSKSLHRVLAVIAPTTIHVCPINQVTGNDLVILGFMASPYYLRHATDAEFDANHRIDSITDDCTDIRNHISPLTGVIER